MSTGRSYSKMPKDPTRPSKKAKVNQLAEWSKVICKEEPMSPTTKKLAKAILPETTKILLEVLVSVSRSLTAIRVELLKIETAIADITSKYP